MFCHVLSIILLDSCMRYSFYIYYVIVYNHCVSQIHIRCHMIICVIFKSFFNILSLLWMYQVLTNQRVSFRSNDHYIDLFSIRKSYTQLAGEILQRKPFIFLHILYSLYLYLCVSYFNACLIFYMYLCFTTNR